MPIATVGWRAIADVGQRRQMPKNELSNVLARELLPTLGQRQQPTKKCTFKCYGYGWRESYFRRWADVNNDQKNADH